MKAIDLFAGAGGFSLGAKMAGIQVVWAANHWQVAVDCHKLNHPGTEHKCQDLHQADWSQVPKHDALLASPCCQGHSWARGKDSGSPQHDASRATAWAVISALEFHQPQLAVIENVPQFLEWNLYPAWSLALAALGYQLALHVIDCADLGVPQHRNRLFIVATRSKAPITLNLDRQEHVSATSFINFDLDNWSLINKPGRALATLNRIKSGRARFGERFVMPYYKSGSGLTGRSIDRPIGTITTRDRWAVVNGDYMRMLSVSECRDAMTFPESYSLPNNRRLAIHLLGNAVPPLAVKHFLTAVLEAA